MQYVLQGLHAQSDRVQLVVSEAEPPTSVQVQASYPDGVGDVQFLVLDFVPVPHVTLQEV